jgi:peptide/nickel transport system substrate-binding protein
MADTTLRIALENVDFRLPTQVTDDNSVLALKSLAFEPLVRWQPDGLVTPGLFASWEDRNAQDWSFRIREDAVFHDGEPCTADDIVAYIHGFLDSKDYFGMSWSYARYFARTTFEAEGDRVVRVRNAEPFPDLLNVLNDFWPCRINKLGQPIIGTGIYRVTEFERRDGTGKATLQLICPSQSSSHPKHVVAIHEPSGEKRLQLLRDGHVDAALNLERVEDLGVLDFSPSSIWGRVTSTLSAIYYLNCTNGTFASPEARLAANLAVDNAALVEEVYQGFASPAATVVSPFHLGHREAGLQPIPYDPAAAREILQHHDITAPIILRTPVYMPEHAQKISRFVASALEAVGFTVKIELETNRPEYARSIGLRKNVGDLALFDSTPNTTFRVLDDKISSANNATWWLGYHDEEFQPLFAKARTEVTGHDRARAYAACLERVQQNPPWLYVTHPHVVWASRPGVVVDVGPSGVLPLVGEDQTSTQTYQQQ